MLMTITNPTNNAGIVTLPVCGNLVRVLVAVAVVLDDDVVVAFGVTLVFSGVVFTTTCFCRVEFDCTDGSPLVSANGNRGSAGFKALREKVTLADVLSAA